MYVVRRLLFSLPAILVTLLLVFLLTNALPGDVIDTLVAGSGLSQEEKEAYKHEVGLDRPAYVRFFTWMGNLAQGELGRSLFTGRAVKDDLAQRAPATLQLGIAAMILAMLIAIPLGVISAIRPNSPVDYVARFFAIGGLATPEFLLAVLAILFVSKYLGFFPGVGAPLLWEDPIETVKVLWLPVLVLGTRQSAAVARMMRSSLLEVLHSPYIRTAWAKGLRERTVVSRHALKNAMIPVITIFGIQVSHVIGGVVILETLFSIPGMGTWLVESIFRRDLVPLQGVVLIFALTVIAANLMVDLSYSWLDPRIRQR